MGFYLSDAAVTFRRGARSVFVRQVGTTFLSQGATLLLSMVTAAITARWLGPAGKGQLALALLLPGMMQLFLSCGVNTANVYHTGSRKLAITDLTSHSVSFAILGTLAGGVIILLLAACHLLPVLVPGLPVGFLLLGMVALPLSLLRINFASVLQGLRRIATLNILNVLQKAFAIPLLLVLVIWLKKGVAGAIVASLVAGFLILLGTAWRLKREGVDFRPRWDGRVVRPTLSYGIKGYVGNVLQFFNYRLDMLLVNAFIGPAGVGIYGASVTLAELLWQLPSSVGYVIFPKAAGTDHDAMNRFTPRVFWAVFIISLIGAVILALFGRLAIHIIFSDAFMGAYLPLLALLPGVVLLGGGKVLTNDIAGRGYPHYNSIVAGLTLVLTIVLDLLLIPGRGVLGAALASTAAYSVTFILSVVFYLMVSRRPVGGEAS